MYQFRYRIQQAPEARNDGSGNIDFDMYSIVSSDIGVTWSIVPGYHRTVSVPSAELLPINDMAHNTASAKNAKNKAITALIKAYARTQVIVPQSEWSDESLLAYMTANDAAILERDRLVDYVTITLNKTFPVDIAS